MRRALLIIFLAIGLSQPAPAHAIFGLSKCEKIKTEIQTLENKLNSNQQKWAKYQNSVLPASIESKYGVYITNDTNLRSIWKLAYNNPKCFTRTQTLQINVLQNLRMTDLIEDYPYEVIRKDVPKCNELMYQIKNLEFCRIRKAIKIGKVFTLDSLYNY